MGFTNFKLRTIIATDSMNVSGNAVFVGYDTGDLYVL